MKFCGVCGETASRRRRWPIVIAACLLFVALSVGFWLSFICTSESLSSDDAIDINTTSITYQETILEEVQASTSKDIPTAVDVSKDLSDRGFPDLELASAYDLSGNMLEDEVIDNSSTERHPLYYAYYLTPDENLWVIYVCNGSYLADSVFAYEHDIPSVLLTEEDFVTCYLANEDKFIESIPDENEQLFKRVNRIDAETLNSLTIEELQKL